MFYLVPYYKMCQKKIRLVMDNCFYIDDKLSHNVLTKVIQMWNEKMTNVWAFIVKQFTNNFFMKNYQWNNWPEQSINIPIKV